MYVHVSHPTDAFEPSVQRLDERIGGAGRDVAVQFERYGGPYIAVQWAELRRLVAVMGDALADHDQEVEDIHVDVLARGDWLGSVKLYADDAAGFEAAAAELRAGGDC